MLENTSIQPTTSDFMFTSDENGFLKQWSFLPDPKNLSQTKELFIIAKNLHKFKKKHHQAPITHIELTADNKTLFTIDDSGCLQEYSLLTNRITKNYGQLMMPPVIGVCSDLDSEF
jgi:hypothetical protein